MQPQSTRPKAHDFLPQYTPDSLSADQWRQWRDPVRSLVAASAPASKVMATIVAGLLCETIALVRPAPGTALADVLDDAIIGLVSHNRRLRGKNPLVGGS